MANILDRFLNSMKLYDEEDEEDEFEDEEEYGEESERAPRRHMFSRSRREEQPERMEASEEEPQRIDRSQRTAAPKHSSVSRASGSSAANNVMSLRNSTGRMEVCMVKPKTLQDAREICDILISGRPVVINMEGVHVDLAQRIIDFASGACYSIQGNLQNISKYIFIVTPKTVGLSGDFYEMIDNKQEDRSSLNVNF